MNRKFETNNKGHLTLGGIDAVDLAKEYGTPLYVMEEDTILSAMREYKASIDRFYDGNGLICFASKAFSWKEIYRIAMREGLGTDVVSGGELYTALSVGFPADRICFHGNNKSDSELEFALKSGVGRIVLDNAEELDRMSVIAEKLGVKAPVMIRIKPGVDAHTHSFVMTGQIDSKFGFALETGEAMAIVKKVIETPNVIYKGVHCHIGSQIHELLPFTETAKIMMNFMAEVKKETGVETNELNLGGGFGITYTDEDKRIEYPAYMEAVSEVIHERSETLGIKLPFILMEPGRSIVGEAGTTLYTVGAVKHIPNIRTYVSIDGGMFDNPRYILYGSKYAFLLANKANEPAENKVTVAGKCCESGDLLGENVSLGNAECGDICAVFSTGAYNYSMSSNYNRNVIPPVVFVKDGKSRIVVKKQTYEDLVRNDI
jgi:diaminopimelate decarboxylase